MKGENYRGFDFYIRRTTPQWVQIPQIRQDSLIQTLRKH